MFTGIIEALGLVEEIRTSGSNKTFLISSPISKELKPDQSVAHNGVCLTVESADEGDHVVTAVAETLHKSNLGSWQAGDRVNLERCLSFNGRLDGHIVQGHVDATGTCVERNDQDGSWIFRFRYPAEFAPLVIEKGSISLNGISLTVFSVGPDEFSVAVIPHTMKHTTMEAVRPGSRVNLEFDLVGKYINRRIQLEPHQ